MNLIMHLRLLLVWSIARIFRCLSGRQDKPTVWEMLELAFKDAEQSASRSRYRHASEDRKIAG